LRALPSVALSVGAVPDYREPALVPFSGSRIPSADGPDDIKSASKLAHSKTGFLASKAPHGPTQE